MRANNSQNDDGDESSSTESEISEHTAAAVSINGDAMMTATVSLDTG